MDNATPNITVLGAGAWGGTLAALLNKKSYRVSMWEFSKEKAALLRKNRAMHIPGVEKFPLEIPRQIRIYDSFAEMNLTGYPTNIVVFAVPSNFLRETAKRFNEAACFNPAGTFFVSATKGLETRTLKTMSRIITEEIKTPEGNVCVLSGPSFAIEVARRISTAVVVASKNEKASRFIQKAFLTDYFRVYTQTDVTGVEMGGSLKNIFAIACGISDGMGMGDNTKAALITRGMKEFVHLATILGAKASTMFGLSGIGDLMTTCFSKHSRNRMLGEMVGKGIKPLDALKRIGAVAEGYLTTESAYRLGKKHNIELPIINEAYHVLYKNKKPAESIRGLMTRQPKSEMQGQRASW